MRILPWVVLCMGVFAHHLRAGLAASPPPRPPPHLPPPYPYIAPPPTPSPWPPSPPPYPAATGYARFFGPLSGTGCQAYPTNTGVAAPVYGGTISIMSTLRGEVIIPDATGAYGTGLSSGTYPSPAGTYPLPGGGCIDSILGLPIPFSITAQYPASSTAVAASFGISSTTTFCEGTSAAGTALPTASLYSILAGSAGAAAVSDSAVLPEASGSTLPAALQAMVADVSSSALLMLAAKFLQQTVPLLCVAAAGYGGTASPLGSGGMDLQVANMATSVVAAAQMLPVYGGGGAAPVLQASVPLKVTDPASVLAVLRAAATTAGCPSNIMSQLPSLLLSASSVAQAISTFADAAESQATTLAQMPIQLVLAMARLVYVAQATVLPLLEANSDVSQYPSYLSPLINEPAVLQSWLQAAAVNANATLSAMGLGGSGGSVASASVQAAAFGAGALQACTVSYHGLVSLGVQNATTAAASGVFTMPDVPPGLYSVPPGCSDYLLMLNSSISYTAVLPSNLGVTAYLGAGVALTSASYLHEQAASPSLPTLSMYNALYDGVLGTRTGFNYLTQSGGSVQWSASAVQVWGSMQWSASTAQLAAFVIDAMIASVVAIGSAFVSGAAGGVPATGSGTTYGALLMTDSYSDEMLGLMASSLPAALYSLAELQAIYINQTALNELIMALYLESSPTFLLNTGFSPSPPPASAVNSSTSPPPLTRSAPPPANASSVGRRLSSSLSGLESSFGWTALEARLPASAARPLRRARSLHSSPSSSSSSSSSLLSSSLVLQLLSPLTLSLVQTNSILINDLLLQAYKCINGGDLVGISLNVTGSLIEAAKVAKVQMSLLATAAASLGAAVGAGNAVLAASIGAAIPSGDAMNVLVYNTTVNSAALPAPCSGASAASSACLGLSAPPPGYGPSGSLSGSNLGLILGLTLGLCIPAVGVLVVAAFLLVRRRRRVQVVTPKTSPAQLMDAGEQPQLFSPIAGQQQQQQLLQGGIQQSVSPTGAGPASPSTYGQAGYGYGYGYGAGPPLSPNGTSSYPMSPGGSAYPPLASSAEWGNLPRPWAFGLAVTASETMGVLPAPPSPSAAQLRPSAQLQGEGSYAAAAGPSTTPKAPWLVAQSGRSLQSWGSGGTLPPMPSSPPLSRLQMMSSMPGSSAMSRLPLSPLRLSKSTQLLGPYGAAPSAEQPPGSEESTSGVSPGGDSNATPPLSPLSSRVPIPMTTSFTPGSAPHSPTLSSALSRSGEEPQPSRMAAAYGPPRPLPPLLPSTSEVARAAAAGGRPST